MSTPRPSTLTETHHPRVRCKARSSRTGEPCRAWAIRGGEVCVAHGGRAPQVRAAADRKRAEDRAIIRIGERVDIDPAEAMLDALGRAHAAVLARASLAELTPADEEQHRKWVHEQAAIARDIHGAGLEERWTRLAEFEAKGLADVVRACAAAAAKGGERAGIEAAATVMRQLGAGA